MSSVQTVRGPVDTADLGKVLMHEHVFVLGEEMRQNYPDYPEPWDEEARVADAVTKLSELKSRGIDRFDGPLQSFGECSRDTGGFTLLTAQRLWQSDDNLNGLVFGHDGDNAPDIRRVGPTLLRAWNRFHRCREDAVGVA